MGNFQSLSTIPTWEGSKTQDKPMLKRKMIILSFNKQFKYNLFSNGNYVHLLSKHIKYMQGVTIHRRRCESCHEVADTGKGE